MVTYDKIRTLHLNVSLTADEPTIRPVLQMEVFKSIATLLKKGVMENEGRRGVGDRRTIGARWTAT
jgi:hypothetical protein